MNCLPVSRYCSFLISHPLMWKVLFAVYIFMFFRWEFYQVGSKVSLGRHDWHGMYHKPFILILIQDLVFYFGKWLERKKCPNLLIQVCRTHILLFWIMLVQVSANGWCLLHGENLSPHELRKLNTYHCQDNWFAFPWIYIKSLRHCFEVHISEIPWCLTIINVF